MFLPLVTVGILAAAHGEEIIVFDDAHANLKGGGKNWTKGEGSCGQAGQGGSFHYNEKVHNEEHLAEWTFDVDKDGCYVVEEYHPSTSSCGFQLSSRVPVQIDYCKGQKTAGLIDQSINGGRWNALVRLPFYREEAAAIRISAKGLRVPVSGIWAADAFRLRWDANACHKEESEQDIEEEQEQKQEQELNQDKEEEKEKPAVALPEKDSRKEPSAAELLLATLQAEVAHSEAQASGGSLDHLQQCPATSQKLFRHDAQQKSVIASARFSFKPPRDGCYVVEERHPELSSCDVDPSTNTPVHIDYCKGLHAVGAIDQTANGGNWSYLASLPFYAGYEGAVTLNNKGTASGTLVTFEAVRFSWVAPSCRYNAAHPRRATLRLTADFATIKGRIADFAGQLRHKLSELTGVPEEQLRVASLRPGSIIAEIHVLPGMMTVDGVKVSHALMKHIQNIVQTHQSTLCALAGAGSECTAELSGIGYAKPVVTPQGKTRPKDEPQNDKPWIAQNIGWVIVAISAVFSIIAGAVLLLKKKSRRAGRAQPQPKQPTVVDGKPVPVKPAQHESPIEIDVEDPADAKLNEGKAKDNEAEDDNNSTVCPSTQSTTEEPSISGDKEPSVSGDSQGEMKPAIAL